MSLLIRARHLLEYAAVRALLTAVLSMGVGGGRRAADFIGALLFRFDIKHRLRALEHLALAFPERTVEEREGFARSSFKTFCRTVVESVFAERLLTPTSYLRHLEMDLHPAAERALAEGKGAIMVSAHIGNWEFTSQAMALLGYPLVSVARPIDNPYLDRLVTGERETRGRRIIPKHGAVRGLTRALRTGRGVGLIADHHAGSDGIVVRYFGRSASTTGAPATLSLRFGVPLIPGWVRRGEGDFRFRITMEAPLTPPDTGDRDRDILELTQAMTSRFEAWVREEPGQWLWAHRRWKAEKRQATPASTPDSDGAPPE